jgi:hypothetical protein
MIEERDEFNLNVDVSYYNCLPYTISRNNLANILYLNARSLRNSLTDLQTFIDAQKFIIHIIVVTETWLKIDDIPFFNLLSYQSFHSVRRNKTGGGVAVFIHNSFDNASLKFEDSSNNNNILIVSLLRNKFKVIGIYRQPNNPNDLYGLHFIDMFETILSKESNACILGDFNFNLLSQSEYIFKYENSYALNGYALLNNVSEHFATRLNPNNNTASIIDHALTDLHLYHKNISFAFHLFHQFADHKSILLSIDTDSVKPQDTSSSICKFKKLINHKKIIAKQLLSNLVPKDFSSFLSDIKQIIDLNSFEVRNHIPIKKPYINQEILNLIKIRNNYFNIKQKYPHYAYANDQYKFFRNLATNKIKESKKKYLDTFLQANASEPRKLWSQFKSLLYNSSNTKQSVEMIMNNGIAITNEKSIANIFNSFFNKKIHNLMSSHTVDDSEFNSFHSYEEYDIFSNFSNPCVTEDEIELIIDNLSNSKSCDAYGLSNYFVKLHKKHLISNLTTLINECMKSQTFPDCLKVAIVKPIFKNGDKSEVSNYRPISILPIFSKIFEYVLKRRLEDYVYANNIMSKTQFGYTKGSNTEVAMIHILDDIYKGVDSNSATALTCLDLSAAFDCVSHSIILNKLRKMKIPSEFLSIFASYFKNRTQFVCIGNSLSNVAIVEYGVAQGGIISGLLFNLYVNSINMINLNSILTMYCDDISLVTIAQNPAILKKMIEEDLLKISIWLKFHFLFPNERKTKYLLFHNKRRHENFYEIPLNIRFNGVIIERVEHTKLLGLEIDETLSFSFHVYELQKKIVSFMFALKRIRGLISEQTALILYFSYIHSRLSYMNCVWSVIPKFLMDSIEIIQRKALRIVFCKDKLCSRTELYSEKILPISLQCKLSSAILVFKMINGSVKLNFQMQYMNQRHRHATRNAANIVIPRTYTQLGAANFFVRAFTDFNSIPLEIKKFVSINIFKSRFRENLYIKQLWYEPET